MNFRQKAALSFVVIFFVGVLSLSTAYLYKSDELNEQFAQVNCKNELRILSASLYTRLNAVAQYYQTFNEHNIGMYVEPYSAYYSGQEVYLQLMRGQEVLYNDFFQTIILNDAKDCAFLDTDQGLFLACQDKIVLSDGQAFELTALWNMDYLRAYRNKLLWFSVAVGILSTLMIGMVGYYLLYRLTKPLRDLGDSARRIAEGNYHERVAITSKDEIGQFARTFNIMADSVERKIYDMDDWVKERQRSLDHLSHEIRTPITAMIGYSQVLMHAKATDEDKQKAVEYIGQQSMRLKLLSEKLMHLSRLQYDEAELLPVKIRDVLCETHKTLLSLLNAKNVRLQIVLPDIQVMGDAVLLETLFQNLIENAIYASNQDQEIEVIGAVEEGFLKVSVQDYGIGIEEQDLESITEPFVRIDAARSGQHGGAGIGLALCKRICDLHQSPLRIASIPKVGTTVSVYFTIV